jgi:hypothetical protein
MVYTSHWHCSQNKGQDTLLRDVCRQLICPRKTQGTKFCKVTCINNLQGHSSAEIQLAGLISSLWLQHRARGNKSIMRWDNKTTAPLCRFAGPRPCSASTNTPTDTQPSFYGFLHRRSGDCLCTMRCHEETCPSQMKAVALFCVLLQYVVSAGGGRGRLYIQPGPLS